MRHINSAIYLSSNFLFVHFYREMRILICNITFYLILLFTDGQSAVEVQLITRKFVEKGSSVTLYCKHNVEQKILHKVSNLTRYS